MKNILVVCPSARDIRELEKYKSHYNLIFHRYTDEQIALLFEKEKDIHLYLQRVADSYREKGIQGVFYTTDYPGSIFGSILAREHGVIGPAPKSVLCCQQKYHSRLIQKEYVPEAVPHFFLLNKAHIKAYHYPFFSKPVKSFFSIGAHIVNNADDFLSVIDKPSEQERSFVRPLDQLCERYLGTSGYSDSIIGEELLEGAQCTIEGFVINHIIHIIGIIDSIMFPNTISFSRFEYPSRLPGAIQERMSGIARRFIRGIGLNNSFFNIEFMYNSQRNSVHIIEVNPRMVSQFADLYEKVDGKSSYELLLELVTGKKPLMKSKEGRFKVAASCVLRTFENHFVKKVPTCEEIEKLYEMFPDSRFELCCIEGKKLSESMQDGKSYRYGLVHLGANSWPELYQAFEEAKQILNFELVPL